jgi:hypothetical protein
VKRRVTWLLLGVLACTLYLGIRHRRDRLVDFEVYRTASLRAIVGEPLYRPEDGHYQYKYLPAFAFAMVPFGALPSHIASAIWYAIAVSLLCLFMWTSVVSLPERRLRGPTLLWIVAILTGKFWVKELMLGQTNVLLGVVVILVLLAAQRGQWRRAAVLVGLGIFTKPYAILFLPWIAVAGGILPAFITVVVTIAGLLLPATVYGWIGNREQLAAWYHTVAGTTPSNLIFPENISLDAMWTRWLGAGADASALTLASTVVLLALPVLAFLMRRRYREPVYLELSLILLLIPLLSPQGWDYVLLLGTPAFVCLIDRWRETPLPWKLAAAVAFALVSFTIFDLERRALYAYLMSKSVVTVGALVLALALCRLRWRGLA